MFLRVSGKARDIYLSSLQSSQRRKFASWSSPTQLNLLDSRAAESVVDESRQSLRSRDLQAGDHGGLAVDEVQYLWSPDRSSRLGRSSLQSLRRFYAALGD